MAIINENQLTTLLEHQAELITALAEYVELVKCGCNIDALGHQIDTASSCSACARATRVNKLLAAAESNMPLEEDGNHYSLYLYRPGDHRSAAEAEKDGALYPAGELRATKEGIEAAQFMIQGASECLMGSNDTLQGIIYQNGLTRSLFYYKAK